MVMWSIFLGYVIAAISLKVKRPYFKSKFQLESNSSEILPVNCKFIRGYTPTWTGKTQTWVPKVRLKVWKEKHTTDEKIFCVTRFRVFRVQLKFVFRIRPKMSKLHPIIGKATREVQKEISRYRTSNANFHFSFIELVFCFRDVKIHFKN